MSLISALTRQTRVTRRAAAGSALALAFAVTACAVEKKQDPSLSDTPTATPPVSSAPGTSAPAQAPKAVESSATPSVPRASTKTRSRGVGGGGERDSVTQAKFEIGPDGKIHPIKR